MTKTFDLATHRVTMTPFFARELPCVKEQVIVREGGKSRTRMYYRVCVEKLDLRGSELTRLRRSKTTLQDLLSLIDENARLRKNRRRVVQ